MKDSSVEIVLQVNGKVRARISVPADADKAAVMDIAKETLADKMPADIKKEIYVPAKLVNIVG